MVEEQNDDECNSKIMLEFRSADIHVQILAAPTEATREILTPDCLRFVGTLCAQFEGRRQALLQARQARAIALDGGDVPHFLTDHPAHHDDWQCAAIPADVADRRVEITGPVDRKMVINGLNSGASVYMADFEDSTSPTWDNLMTGQVNLRDAVNRSIAYTDATTGKSYQLQTKLATLMVRPRGWHLDEAHLLVNGRVASGSIFDFSLYLFHNHAALKQNGTGPYYYVPKMECHQEAALWNDVFVAAQNYLGLPRGTVRATALLETITAAYEMEEILYELRDHSYVFVLFTNMLHLYYYCCCCWHDSSVVSLILTPFLFCFPTKPPPNNNLRQNHDHDITVWA
jgi:malate synthase